MLDYVAVMQSWRPRSWSWGTSRTKK